MSPGRLNEHDERSESAEWSDSDGAVSDAIATELLRHRQASAEELSKDATAIYMREIAHHELLAAQEEVALAQRLEIGKAARHKLATAGDALDAERRLALEGLAEDGDAGRPLD